MGMYHTNLLLMKKDRVATVKNTVKKTDDFDAEYNAFMEQQRKLKEERLAAEAVKAEQPAVEETKTEEVAEPVAEPAVETAPAEEAPVAAKTKKKKTAVAVEEA